VPTFLSAPSSQTPYINVTCIHLTKFAYHSIKNNLIHHLQQAKSFDTGTTSGTQCIVIMMIYHHQQCHTHSNTITSSFHTTVWCYIKQIYNVYLLPSNTTMLIKYPGYRKSLYYVSFRQHVSTVKRPSSGLYRASYIKYNGFDTQWDSIVFTVVL
jgi:hypothetical protein